MVINHNVPIQFAMKSQENPKPKKLQMNPPQETPPNPRKPTRTPINPQEIYKQFLENMVNL